LATPLSRPLPDAGGRLNYLSLTLAAVFGRPRQNFQEIIRCFPIATRFPDRIDSLLQMRSESETQLTLVKQVKSARVTIRQTQAATDSTRMLRMPGFVNQKLSEQFIVQARHESDVIYMARDFTIQEDSPETPRDLGHTQEGRRTVPREHKSQSERDWAFAKRALARGDDPDVVVQRIADYRAEDKADPNYYARRTVMKAQTALQRQSNAEQYGEDQRTPAKAIALDH
jgi:hypothetical protein